MQKHLKIDKELTKYANLKLSNVEIQVYLSNSNIVNAWTFPGVDSFEDFITNPDKTLIKAYQKMQKRNHKNMKVAVVVTRGLKKILTTREIFAIILHELGHWFYYHDPKVTSMLSVSSVISMSGAILSAFFANTKTYSIILSALFVTLLSFGRLRARNEEFKADEFAAKMGYAKDLESALSKIDPDSSEIDITIWYKFTDILKSILLGRVHPDTALRRDKLSKYELDFTAIASEIPW